MRVEGQQPFGAHYMAHGYRLIDDLGTAVCIERGHDDGAVGFLCQLADRARYPCVQTDHDAACLHLDRTKLGFVSVAHDDHIVLADVFLHHIRVGRRNDYAALFKMRVQIADRQFSVEHVNQIAVAGTGFGQCVCVLILHVKTGDIGQRQQALQMVFLIHNRNGLDIVLAHIFPCTPQGNVRADAIHHAVLHIRQAGVEGRQIPRRFHTEGIQHIFGFRVDVPRAAGDIFVSGQDMFEPGIADRGTDRIGIRIFMPDHENWLHTVIAPFFLFCGALHNTE